VDEIGEVCSMYWRDEKFLATSGEKPEQKRLLTRTNHRWEDNVKTDLKINGLDSSASESYQMAGSYEYGKEPSSSIYKVEKFLIVW